jgi:hypothetical protein
MQTPLWQVSFFVHIMLSSHDGLPGFGTGSEHTPVSGSHVPALLHMSAPPHDVAVTPTHAPVL